MKNIFKFHYRFIAMFHIACFLILYGCMDTSTDDIIDERFQYDIGTLPISYIIDDGYINSYFFDYDYEKRIVTSFESNPYEYYSGNLVRATKFESEDFYQDFIFDEEGNYIGYYAENGKEGLEQYIEDVIITWSNGRIIRTESAKIGKVESYDFSYKDETNNIDTMWYSLNDEIRYYLTYRYDTFNHPYANLNVPRMLSIDDELIVTDNNCLFMTYHPTLPFIENDTIAWEYRYAYNNQGYPLESKRYNLKSENLSITRTWEYIN